MEDFYEKAAARWRNLAKPLGGLGLLEECVCAIAATQRTETPDISRRVLAVFCADNGIVEAGVSQVGSFVTRAVAEGLSRGAASVCKMAAVARCDVLGVDCGILRTADARNPPPGFSDCFIANGTANFLKADAMTRAECETAIQNGICLAADLRKKGYALFATGEVGIGNTTTASAALSVLLGRDARETTGRGAGLSDEGLARKVAAVRDGIRLRRPDARDAVDVLSKVGGFDIATMCGFFLGARKTGTPCIIDGFISGVAALCAERIAPGTKSALLASHESGEPGGRLVLDALGLSPVVTARMRLGEGTGCMALIPLLDMALKVFFELPTFGDMNIAAYTPF